MPLSVLTIVGKLKVANSLIFLVDAWAKMPQSSLEKSSEEDYFRVMKGSTVSKDYSALENEMAGDLNAAATSVALMSGGGTKKVRLHKSHLKGIIPDGAVIEVQSLTFTKLSMGDIICVTQGSETVLRRFIRLKMTNKDTYLETTHDGSDQKEPLSKSALVGRVISVKAGGRDFDPHKAENPFSRLWGKLTEYGTHKAFGLFG